MSKDELRAVMKDALIEALEERRDLVQQILVEAMEDAGLLNAMRQGEGSGYASRDELMKVLRAED